MAILGFADKEAKSVFYGDFSRRLPVDVQQRAYRKMLYMDSVDTLNDLCSPPSNHLEPLQGDRIGQYSIRINKQYRICFTVYECGFDDVEIEWIITERRKTMTNKIPVPPLSEFLTEEFMKPLRLTAHDLSEGANIPVSEVCALLNDEIEVTHVLSAKLGAFFGISDNVFYNLQQIIRQRVLEQDFHIHEDSIHEAKVV